MNLQSCLTEKFSSNKVKFKKSSSKTETLNFFQAIKKNIHTTYMYVYSLRYYLQTL